MSDAKLVALVEANRQAVVQLSLLVQRGEGSDPSGLLARWEPPHADPARLVAEAMELAQSDANVQRVRCQYSFSVLGKPPVHRRLAFAPQPDAEPVIGPTEPPTHHGLAAMLMRHMEGDKRAQVGVGLDIAAGYERLLDKVLAVVERQEGQIKDSQQAHKQAIDLYASLRAKDREFELALATLAHESQGRAEVLDKVLAPLMPHVGPQLGRGVAAWLASKLPGSPAPSPPRAPVASTPAPPPPAASPGGAAAEAPPADAGAASPPAPEVVEGEVVETPAAPRAGLRELVMLFVQHDVPAEEIAEAIASKLPEAERPAARLAVVQAVRDALGASP